MNEIKELKLENKMLHSKNTEYEQKIRNLENDLRSLRKDYAIKICEYYGIEIEDINNDFITISGVKYSLDKDLFSLKSSIEIVKASEELPNSISNSNDSGKKRVCV